MNLSKTSPALLVALLGATLAGCAQEQDTGETVGFADEYEPPRRFAPDQLAAEDNDALWSEYCVGGEGVRVQPNYENPEVLEAAARLSEVSSHSFALYGDIKRHHDSDVPEELTDSVSDNAHEFLAYTCGEFRDRATMVAAKIRWVRTMNYLDDEDTGAHDPAGDPWQQMKKSDYHPYLKLSHARWNALRDARVANGTQTTSVGSIEVDTPIAPQTVCETKYMFAAYVKQGKSFDDLESYQSGYDQFREAYCTLPDDEDYYYDFRGDSNIKPNSPESNGMIWFGRTMARQCDSRQSAQPYAEAREESSLSDAECRRYYKYPFTSRWNAARAGLASWVLVDPDSGSLGSNDQYTVFPRYMNDDEYLFGDRGPFRAQKSSGDRVEILEGWQDYWFYGALGLPDLHEGDKEKIYRMLQIAVDRHTDWYDSGYDDLMEYKPYESDRAYSPFVASSYEMEASDAFVTPGYTASSFDPASKDYKHWMFVFRVHKDNWYTPERINDEELPVPNFDTMWFDETSFGQSSLADSEKAWDRMGTALEAEHDTLLYLHNLPSD